MPAHAAIGIDDDFSSGQTGIAMRSADHKAAGRIDVELGLRIDHIGGNHRIDDVLLNVGAQLLG